LLDIQAQMVMVGTASILDLRGVVDGLFGGCHGGVVYLDYSRKGLLSGFSAASDTDYDLLADLIISTQGQQELHQPAWCLIHLACQASPFTR